MRKWVNRNFVTLLLLIPPLLYVILTSIWHGFGINGVQPWKAIYFLSNHLFFIYLALVIYFTSGIHFLQKIMKYMIVPYVLIKIVYQLLIWMIPNLGNGVFFTYMWSLICVLTFLIGSVFVWMQLKKIG